MKFNPRLKQEIENFKDYTILVEGKKDVRALKAEGFKKVYAIHQNGIALKESIEQLAEKIENKKKEKVCILTDFDKRGKELYYIIKDILQQLGVKVDSRLRGLLIKSGLSHIEGIYNFLKKVEDIN